MTTNGTPKPPDDALGLVGHFHIDKWRKLTELAVQEGEKRLAQALEAINEAQDAVLQRQRELDVLRRALTLEVQPAPSPAPIVANGLSVHPPAPTPAPVRDAVLALTRSPDEAEVVALPPPPEIGKTVRDGNGNGYRAGMYLMEVIRLRGDGTLSRAQAILACSGWKIGTVQDGLHRLLRDGLLERYGKGLYRLTQAGRDLCADGPVPAVLLPLSDPGREEGKPEHPAPEFRPAAEWVRERVTREYGEEESATLLPKSEENGALVRS